MPRRFLRKFMPRPHPTATTRWGKLIHNPNLWHLNRHSVSRAIAIGVFWAFAPYIPFLPVIAATLLAIRFRANVAVAVTFTWVNNPLTLAPAVYLSYLVGRLILRQPPIPDFHPTWQWIQTNQHAVWLPFAVGSMVLSIGLAVLCYFISQQFWKYRVARRWSQRGHIPLHTPPVHV